MLNVSPFNCTGIIFISLQVRQVLCVFRRMENKVVFLVYASRLFKHQKFAMNAALLFHIDTIAEGNDRDSTYTEGGLVMA